MWIRDETAGLRAFDWVDYILYMLATGSFAISITYIIYTGALPAWLISDKNFQASPILSDQDQYWWTASALLLFVIFVYIRNYFVMHRIDNRVEAPNQLFKFLDYNNRGWYQSERLARAAIILWVIISTIGAVGPVTRLIDQGISMIVSATIGYTAFLTMSVIDRFFTYYGVVLTILFLLFIIWDVINIGSIGSQIRNGKFDLAKTPDSPAEDGIKGFPVRIAMPPELAHSPPVLAIVAYIRPPAPDLHSLSSDGARRKGDERCQALVRSGRLLRLYFRFGGKFNERLIGLLIGIALLSTPWLGAQLVPIAALIGAYFFTMRKEVPSTLAHILKYSLSFALHRPPDWADAPRVGDFAAAGASGGAPAQVDPNANQDGGKSDAQVQ